MPLTIGVLDKVIWTRLRQAAEIFSVLPDGVAALVSRHLPPPTALRLSQAALIQEGPNAALLRKTLRSFALELQLRSRAQLPDFSRRSLFQLCRFHPQETAALLEQWLAEPEPTPQPAPLAISLAEIDWAHCNIEPDLLGCLLLMQLEPQVACGLFKLLQPEEVHQLTLLICHLPPLSPDLKAACLELFKHHPGGWESLAKDHPQAVAEWLRHLLECASPWERPLSEDWTKIKLSGPSLAAILLDFLRPSWRAEFIRGLEPRSAEHLEVASRVLCPAGESLVQQLINDFTRQFGPLPRLQENPAILQSCLQRIARKPQEQELPKTVQGWTGLLVLYGDLLEDYFGEKPNRSALSLHRAELESAWGRIPQDYSYLRRDQLDPHEVVLRKGERELERFELRPGHCLVWRNSGPVWVEGKVPELSQLEPEVRIESNFQVTVRQLWSAQAKLAHELPLCVVTAPDLLPESLPALAALRSFPANLLSSHLEELDHRELGLVAESLSELFALSNEDLAECLRNSCLISPGELMQRAGLQPGETSPDRLRISRVAVLLTLAPNSRSMARELLKGMDRKLALRITERMMRLFYRWEERRLEPKETHPTVAGFLSWRTSGPSCPRNACSAELADSIVKVWPFWNEEEALRIFREQVCSLPERAAQQLGRYLREGPEVDPWVPGPVLAAQFLNTLHVTEELRRELCWRNYPLPSLPVDLALLQRAQQDWNRASA